MHYWNIFLEQIGGWLGFYASVTALLSVILAVRNHIGTWPLNIVSVALYGWWFYINKMPANAALNALYYFPISIYGWYVWMRRGPKQDNDLPVTHLNVAQRLLWIAITAVGSLLVGSIEAHFHYSEFPFADATTTVISITAQYLQAFKRIENWHLWLIANVIYAFYIFPRQHYYAVAALYFFFLCMAAAGAIGWRRIMLEQTASPPASASNVA